MVDKLFLLKGKTLKFCFIFNSKLCFRVGVLNEQRCKKNMDKISNALSETLLDKEKFDGYINNDFNDNPVEECIKLL